MYIFSWMIQENINVAFNYSQTVFQVYKVDKDGLKHPKIVSVPATNILELRCGNGLFSLTMETDAYVQELRSIINQELDEG